MRAMRDDQLALLEEENRRSSEFNEEFEKEFGHVWSAKQQQNSKRRNCGGGNKPLMDDLFLWYLIKRSREDDRF